MTSWARKGSGPQKETTALVLCRRGSFRMALPSRFSASLPWEPKGSLIVVEVASRYVCCQDSVL